MKTALYFDEQDVQLALTAETPWEKTVLKMMKERLPGVAFEGGFYECQGGWVKHNYVSARYDSYTADDYKGESLMIRMPKNSPLTGLAEDLPASTADSPAGGPGY